MNRIIALIFKYTAWIALSICMILLIKQIVPHGESWHVDGIIWFFSIYTAAHITEIT